MASNPGPIVDLIFVFRDYFQARRMRREMKRAEQDRAAHEAMVRRQQAEWRAEVESQKLHGDAGDATETEAITALGGWGVARDGGFD